MCSTLEVAMPWHVTKSSACPVSRPWAVIQNNNAKIMGCHLSKPAALKQMAALYKAEPGMGKP